MSQRLILISTALLLALLPGHALAITEFAIATGTVTADYTETTDAQSKSLRGNDAVLQLRSLRSLGFLDFGFDWGTLSLGGNTGAQEVDYTSDYVNLLTGLHFSPIPSWIVLTVDLGLRLSVDRMVIKRSTGQAQYNLGALKEEWIQRYGFRILLGPALFIGLSVEEKGTLFDKSAEGLQPKLGGGQATLVSLGYRFGASGPDLGTQIKSGRPAYTDPCVAFAICKWQ